MTSVKFDAVCKALQDNGPKTTSVVVLCSYDEEYGDYCPSQYGPQLGDALRGNTVVDSIELQLGSLIQLTSDGKSFVLDSGDSVLSFLRQSKSLRNVKLRTSGNMDGDRGICTEERRLVHNAIMAVAENPHGPISLNLDGIDVDECIFPVDVPPKTLATALRVTTSLEAFVIWLGDGGTPGFHFTWRHDNSGTVEENEPEKAAARARVAPAFGDNCSLKRLTILPDSDERSIEATVQSLRRNGSLLSVIGKSITPRQQSFVQMYCERNKGVVDFLGQLRRHTQQSKEGTGMDREQATRRLLLTIPEVGRVTQHTPRMCPSRMLQMLQALPEHEGLTATTASSTKRAASVAAETTTDDVKRPAKKRT